MSIINNEKIKPWHKEFYVWMIIFFPMLAVVAGIYTIILAIQSDDGLVVDDYYKEGLEINRTIERDKIASDYQLNTEVNLNEELEEVAITLIANTDFVYPKQLSISFLHATRAGLDKQANVLLTNENVYRGNLSKLSPGKWYVHMQHDDWRLIKIIYIDQ